MNILNGDIIDNKYIILILVAFIMFFYIFNYTNLLRKNSINDISINNNIKIKNVIEILKWNSENYPDVTALITKNKDDIYEVNYKEYYRFVKKFAESLNCWLGNGTNLGIIGHNSTGFYYGYLGSIMNGGFPVVIDENLGEKDMISLINSVNIEVMLVGSNSILEKLKDYDIKNIKLIIYYSPIDEKIIDKFTIPVLGMSNFLSKKVGLSVNKASQDSIATIIHKNNKLIPITNRNIIDNVSLVIKMINNNAGFKIKIGERFISYLPLNDMIIQVIDIYLPLIQVGTVFFADNNSFKKGSITNDLKYYKPTIFFGIDKTWDDITIDINNMLNTYSLSPDVMKYILAKKIRKYIGLDKCKYCLSFGSKINKKHSEIFSSIGVTIHNSYCLNEACGIVTLSTDKINKKNSVGKPIIKVMIGKNNEIMLKGSSIFNGYYNDNNKKYFKNKYFRTGDIGYLDKNGYVHVIGKIKDLITIKNNETLPPQRLEYEIREHLDDYFSHIMVTKNKQKELVAIFTPRTVSVKSNKLSEKFQEINNNLLSIEDIDGNKDLNKFIKNNLDVINQRAVSKRSKIKKWIIISDKFVIGQHLDLYYRINRDFIHKNYKKLLI